MLSALKPGGLYVVHAVDRARAKTLRFGLETRVIKDPLQKKNSHAHSRHPQPYSHVRPSRLPSLPAARYHLTLNTVPTGTTPSLQCGPKKKKKKKKKTVVGLSTLQDQPSQAKPKTFLLGVAHHSCHSAPSTVPLSVLQFVSASLPDAW
jgi:hypothetical protein